jgi:hypothetical protein
MRNQAPYPLTYARLAKVLAMQAANAHEMTETNALV